MTLLTAELTPAQVGEFVAGLKGTVIRSTDPEYETARRVWNGAIDRRPGLIVCVADLDDIRRTVAFARDYGLALSIRSGAMTCQVAP